MKICDIQVLMGPNRWSNYRQKLIVLKLDIQEYEKLPTNLLPGFTESLLKLIPSLSKHSCSRKKEGGFIERLQEGTWIGHVVEHIALELQSLAGMECAFGRTYSSKDKNVYDVIFSFELESAGIFAGNSAVNIAECLANNKQYDYLEEVLSHLKTIRMEQGLGPSTKAIVDEAQKRHIPWHRPFEDSNIILGHGRYQKKICAALTSNTSSIAVDLVSDKDKTKKALDFFQIPTPKGIVAKKIADIKKYLNKNKFPIVIKPLNGNQGKGVTTNINSMKQISAAFKEAKKISSSVIVEEYIPGSDFRFLVINRQLVSVAYRKPASIIGDGVSDLEQLIEDVNADSKRGEGHSNELTKIKIDKEMLKILKEKELTLNSILPKGEEIFLRGTANLSTGGTAIDVTNAVHPHYKWLAERIASLVDLDICGIDIITPNIRIPITNNNGSVIEVNASPGLRMHLQTTHLKESPAKHIIDHLFPEGKPSRIPITAVTGTNGKTTTVRLLAYFAMQAGYNVGYTTTDGIYINKRQILKGDCSGFISARTILLDPTVDYAVLECARGGILNNGLGFDKCNISIVTNIAEDHLGLDGINTIDELAEVKSVVPLSTFNDGYAILNADDNRVYNMKENLTCKVALFSMNKDNLRIKKHCSQNGMAIYLDKEQIIFKNGSDEQIVTNIHEVPLTFNGNAKFMIQNILPAILAGIINHFEIKDIAKWLKDFLPSPEHTPGRMNIFNFEKFNVMVDYGHNTAAFLELKKFFQTITCHKKIGIIGSPGDRRNIDIEKVGFHAAEIFDEIIIRLDKNGRGRTNEEIIHLLQTGIKCHDPLMPFSVICDEKEALDYAMKNASDGSFIAYFPEDVHAAVNHLQSMDKIFERKDKLQ